MQEVYCAEHRGPTKCIVLAGNFEDRAGAIRARPLSLACFTRPGALDIMESQVFFDDSVSHGRIQLNSPACESEGAVWTGHDWQQRGA